MINANTQENILNFMATFGQHYSTEGPAIYGDSSLSITWLYITLEAIKSYNSGFSYETIWDNSNIIFDRDTITISQRSPEEVALSYAGIDMEDLIQEMLGQVTQGYKVLIFYPSDAYGEVDANADILSIDTQGDVRTLTVAGEISNTIPIFSFKISGDINTSWITSQLSANNMNYNFIICSLDSDVNEGPCFYPDVLEVVFQGLTNYDTNLEVDSVSNANTIHTIDGAFGTNDTNGTNGINGVTDYIRFGFLLIGTILGMSELYSKGTNVSETMKIIIDIIFKSK